MKASQNERKLIIDKAKAKITSEKEEIRYHDIPLESYDNAKLNEGARFYDDFKSSKYVLKDEEKEQDLIVDSIPNPRLPSFIDTLEGLKIDEPIDPPSSKQI